MRENNSNVWSDFVKIALDQGLITSDLTPEQEYISDRNKKVPTGDEYSRNKKTESYEEMKLSDLIGKAHPKDSQMAKAMGKGGLVENIIQQQEKDIEIANKMPNGSLHGVHANVVLQLVKLANELENQGKFKAAKKVDAALRKIRPFYNDHLRKEAFWGTVLKFLLSIAPMAFNYWKTSTPAQKTPYGKMPGRKGKFLKGMGKGGWFTLGIGVLSSLLPHLSSIQESLKDDIKDLYTNLDDIDSKTAKTTAQQIKPFVYSFQSLDLATEDGFKKYLDNFHKLETTMPKIESNISKIILEIGSPKWYQFGLTGASKLEAKFEDFKESFENSKKLIRKILSTGNKMDQAAVLSAQQETGIKLSEVEELQKILFNRGYMGKTWNGEVTGNMDEETIAAAKNLEMALSSDLHNFLTERGKTSDFTGKIVKNKQVVMDPKVLKEIITLTERVL